jgi:protein gp37
MAERSAIEWCDSTVNFWWGCTKVSAACERCYAETWSKRFNGEHWGAGAPRRKIKGARALLHRLDNDYSEWAADFYSGHLPAGCGSRRRVFCMSMGDLFDKEVPIEWFVEAWQTIKACDRVDIIIVTKRLSMIERRLGEAGFSDWPPHAWLLTSVHDQASADREGPRLLDLKSKFGIPVTGFSIEPMLGPIDLTAIKFWSPCNIPEYGGEGHELLPALRPAWRKGEGPGLDWVIAGGESGPGARDNDFELNARALLAQCRAAGVPFFGKQNVGKKPLPDDLLIREFPESRR